MLAEKLERHRDKEEQNKLSGKVLVMQPILRFLQLLCENHNRYLQVSTAVLAVIQVLL
jgi:inositol 1,4,5-triphosphate receptor type 1